MFFELMKQIFDLPDIFHDGRLGLLDKVHAIYHGLQYILIHGQLV